MIPTRLHIILQRFEIPFLLNGGNCVLCEHTQHIFLSSMVPRAFNNHKIGNRQFQNYLRIIWEGKATKKWNVNPPHYGLENVKVFTPQWRNLLWNYFYLLIILGTETKMVLFHNTADTQVHGFCYQNRWILLSGKVDFLLRKGVLCFQNRCALLSE